MCRKQCHHAISFLDKAINSFDGNISPPHHAISFLTKPSTALMGTYHRRIAISFLDKAINSFDGNISPPHPAPASITALFPEW
jgi:hypothetical protein